MKKLQYRLRIWRQIKPYIKAVRIFYLGDVTTEILIRGITLLFPVLYGVLLEKVILEKQSDYLWRVIEGYLLLQLVKSCLMILQRICQNRVVNEVACKMKVDLFRNYLQMPVRDYSKLSGGDMKMTLEDAVDKLADFPSSNYRYWLNMLYIPLLTAALLKINWILTIVALLSIPVTFLLDHMVSRREKKVNDILNENDASWATWLDETIHEWKEIRVHKCEKMRREEFEEFQETDETYFSTWLRYWVTRVLVIPTVKDDFFMQFLMYFLGGFLIYYKQLSIGMLLVFIQYFSILSEQVKAVSGEDANLQSDMAHYQRILNQYDAAKENVSIEKYVPEDFDMTLEKISFRYEKDGKNIINDLSLQIKKGDRIGFYGESGSGKSTLLKLMLGILEPAAGQIRYGKHPLYELDKKILYQNIAYISQEAVLYNESVLENLRLVKEDATLEEIEVACKKAGIYDVIMALPEGFDTEIGENGSLLSGGQRQRLILAKAFLKDAKIFMLDEATSALDHQVEKFLIDSLKSIARDKTVIIVAHKENSLNMCDSLVRLG